MSKKSTTYTTSYNVPIEFGDYTYLEGRNGIKTDLDLEIKKVQDLLKRKYGTVEKIGKCRVLLHRFGYKMKDLGQAIITTTTMEELFRKKFSIAGTPYIKPELHDSNEMCNSCDIKSTKELSCKHVACPEHWWQHFAKIFAEKRYGFVVNCVDFNCEVVLYDEMVEEIIRMTTKPNNVLKDRLAAFDTWKVDTYLFITKFHETIAMCPHNCEQYVKIPDKIPRKIRLPCNHTFLQNRCCNTWHAPVPCFLWKFWKAAELDQAAINESKFIDENTTRCPLCSMPIQKNDDKPIVDCTQCGHNFCLKCSVAHKEPCNRRPFKYTSYFCVSESLKRLAKMEPYHDEKKTVQIQTDAWGLKKIEINNLIDTNREVLNKAQLISHEKEFLEKIVSKLIGFQKAFVCLSVFGFFFVRNNLEKKNLFDSKVGQLAEFCNSVIEELCKDLRKFPELEEQDEQKKDKQHKQKEDTLHKQLLSWKKNVRAKISKARSHHEELQRHCVKETRKREYLLRLSI